MGGYSFTITGDPTFDFFFSLVATGGIIIFLISLPLALFRGRV